MLFEATLAETFSGLYLAKKKNRNAKDEVRGLEATLPRDVYKAWYGERFHEEPI